MNRPLIIHHGSCPDGFGAAWLLGRFLGAHDKYAASYGEDPPLDQMAERDVWIVDFCYPSHHLAAIIANTSETVMILDHHQSAVDYVANTDGLNVWSSYDEFVDDTRESRCHAIVDQTHSGIGIVGQWVNEWDGVIPAFAENIEDRDLWRFKYANTPAVFAAVTSHPYTDDAWDDMAKMDYVSLIREGEAIERYRQQLISAAVDLALQRDFTAWTSSTHPDPYVLVLDEPDIWIANAPYAICSDVAGELAKRDPTRFAATFFVDEQGWKWSLRSGPDGMDVAEVAAKMQPGVGGGHKHAAGFRGVW